MEEEVHVRIDHARHQGHVAELDDLCAGGCGAGHDALTLYQEQARRKELAGAHVQHVRGFQHDGLRRVLRLHGAASQGKCQASQKIFHGLSRITHRRQPTFSVSSAQRA